METDKYHNPRIEHHANYQQCDAANGVVYVDIKKTLWFGLILVTGTIGSILTFSLSGFALFVSFTLITLCFGHSLGMHRRFIHRSYQCPKWMEIFFVHLGTIVGLDGPLGMLRTHDLRDWAQRQTSCHDYFAHARPWYQDAYWQLFCSIKLERPPVFEIESDIEQDQIYQVMQATWMLQQLPWVLLFYWLGGWSWVFWGVCSRVLVSVFGHWFIGYFAHNQGHRDWHINRAAVQGYNIAWCSLLTMGECWHNNHHAYPYSAKLGLQKNQWDPGWWVLLGLEKMNLVSDLVLPNKNDERLDLVAVNSELFES